MAQLGLPIFPEFLFRYRALTGDDDVLLGPDTVFNREVEAITQPYIWCADFRHLNDPMEGLFAPTRRLRGVITGLDGSVLLRMLRDARSSA